MQAMWGIHNNVLGRELLEQGFVSIGWDELGDLTAIGADREAIKSALIATRPDDPVAGIPNQAGVIYRFAFDVEPGDLVVAPLKANSTLSFGVVDGPYAYAADAPAHRHRRPVTWLKTGVARSHFSAEALSEIGSLLTLFRVARNDEEFRRFIDASPEDEALFQGGLSGLEPTKARRDLFAYAALQTLDELGRAVPKAEVMGLVAERLAGQPTELESSPSRAGDPTPRWQIDLAWSSTNMKAAGWLEKTPDGWLLAEAGRRALAEHPDGIGITAKASSLYKAELNSHRSAQSRYEEALVAALAMLEPGSWTTYADLATAVGTNAPTVSSYLTNHATDVSHRVLTFNGRPSDAFTWPPGAERSQSQREALEEEGVAFDESGRADEARRIHSGEIRARLEKDKVVVNPTQRAWLVRDTRGGETVLQWLRRGRISARSQVPAVEAGVGWDQLKPLVDDAYSDRSYAAKAAKLDELHAFLTRMSAGDLVAVSHRNCLFVGTIAGEPEASADEEEIARPVAWGPDAGTPVEDLPKPLRAKLNVQVGVVELSQQHATLARLLAPVPATTPVAPTVALSDATPELATSLHVDQAWLQECIHLLRDRPQLIFYGPPGTGKTYLATALAEHLAGDNVRLVQFHPSYSYEDFFEGFRPDPAGGFALRPGPMRKTVDAARENPSTPYFLIIDEINRGNLAKIFGELYFLLEYRDRNVDLLYATDDDIGFSLPENVFIIGTMNTADRSIALVDAAMRRRFAFLPLHPDDQPTRGVLRRWLRAERYPSHVADLMDALNARIPDPDFKIGPSYFMRSAVHSEGGLERTWRTAILPLLEEFHYGDGTDVGVRYGLATLRAELAGSRPATDVDDEPTDATHAS